MLLSGLLVLFVVLELLVNYWSSKGSWWYCHTQLKRIYLSWSCYNSLSCYKNYLTNILYLAALCMKNCIPIFQEFLGISLGEDPGNLNIVHRYNMFTEPCSIGNARSYLPCFY